jgi:hypothetical protein
MDGDSKKRERKPLSLTSLWKLHLSVPLLPHGIRLLPPSLPAAFLPFFLIGFITLAGLLPLLGFFSSPLLMPSFFCPFHLLLNIHPSASPPSPLLLFLILLLLFFFFPFFILGGAAFAPSFHPSSFFVPLLWGRNFGLN